MASTSERMRKSTGLPRASSTSAAIINRSWRVASGEGVTRISTSLSEVTSPRAAEPKSSTRLTGLPRNADRIASRSPVAGVALCVSPLCYYRFLDHIFRCQSWIVISVIAIGRGSISLRLKQRCFEDGVVGGDFAQPLNGPRMSSCARQLSWGGVMTKIHPKLCWSHNRKIFNRLSSVFAPRQKIQGFRHLSRLPLFVSRIRSTQEVRQQFPCNPPCFLRRIPPPVLQPVPQHAHQTRIVPRLPLSQA